MAIKKYSSGQWVDIPYRKYESASDTITTLPKTIIADDQSASAIIKGNLSQSGTPTPASPIYPTETGDKTANLFDEIYPDIVEDTPKYKSIYIGNGTFTLSTNSPMYANSAVLFFIAGNVSSGASTNTNGVSVGVSRTVTAIDGYVTIAYRWYTGADPRDYQTMLNTGSTALPYQPPGYKIPILSGNTTTNEYLGQVQSTRRIRELVLTGEEDWGRTASGCFYITRSSGAPTDYLSVQETTTVCSHFATIANLTSTQYVTDRSVCFYYYSGTQSTRELYLRYNDMADVTALKTYLQQQYANGTPVTVWYILATPTTGIVNEPIRLIGTYADSVSVSGIPTTGTAEQFDVDTTLKPSEVQLTYHGWHEHQDTKYTE